MWLLIDLRPRQNGMVNGECWHRRQDDTCSRLLKGRAKLLEATHTRPSYQVMSLLLHIAIDVSLCPMPCTGKHTYHPVFITLFVEINIFPHSACSQANIPEADSPLPAVGQQTQTIFSALPTQFFFSWRACFRFLRCATKVWMAKYGPFDCFGAATARGKSQIFAVT